MYIFLSPRRCSCVFEDGVSTHVLDPSGSVAVPDLLYQFAGMFIHIRVSVQHPPVNRCTVLHTHMCGFITLLVNL